MLVVLLVILTCRPILTRCSINFYTSTSIATTRSTLHGEGGSLWPSIGGAYALHDLVSDIFFPAREIPPHSKFNIKILIL